MNASKIKKVFECEDFYVENLDGVINEKHFNKNYIVAPDASGVIAIDDGGNILLINEWRLKSNSFQIRIPAGRSKENETSLDCAKREFREEVGLDAEEFTLFMQYANTSSFTKQNISFLLHENFLHPN